MKPDAPDVVMKRLMKSIMSNACARLEAALCGGLAPDGYMRRVNPLTGRVVWRSVEGRVRSSEVAHG